MQLTKREFLKKLGLLSAASAAGALKADEFIATNKTLPPGAVGDPANVWFGQRIYPIPHTIEDVPSCYLKDGKVIMPAHEVPRFYETDVVVVGGGPAGFAAAVAAGRAGAKVALVESAGSLGGLFTNGMVLIVLATGVRQASGDWQLVTRGICEEFMRRARAMGAIASTQEDPENKRRHWQPTIDPEGAKYLMDRMCEEAKVETFFHATGIDVIQDGDKVLGVVFQSKQGPQAILARQVVDCTGDGDIFFAAGCGFRQITHGIGSVARYGNIDRVKAKRPPRNAPLAYDGLGKPWPTRSNEGNGSVWWGGRLGPQGDGLSVRDLSKAEVLHRRFWWEHAMEMRKTKGWEEVYVANICSMIGPRATRLLEAELIIDRAAEAAHQNEHEVIGWCGNCGPHNGMAVSYRSLVPKKGENILAAGRCLGAPDTVDTFRLIAPCFVTGQAAGVAAALAAQKGIAPRALVYSDLRHALEEQKVFLG